MIVTVTGAGLESIVEETFAVVFCLQFFPSISAVLNNFELVSQIFLRQHYFGAIVMLSFSTLHQRFSCTFQTLSHSMGVHYLFESLMVFHIWKKLYLPLASFCFG